VPYENLDVIRSLVNLAGMGTRLSKLWLSADLEVNYGIVLLYHHGYYMMLSVSTS